MLKEIFSQDIKDINIYSQRKKIFSPGKTKKIPLNKVPSFKSMNSSPKKNNKSNNNNKPLLENKINIIMNRPDFTFKDIQSFISTTTTNKNNFKTPKNEKLIINEINNKKTNEKQLNPKIDNNIININNLEQKSKDINLKLNNYIINEKGKNITQIDIKKDEEQNNISDSKTKTKPETNKSFELNKSVLSVERIEKIKLLEEYISQIKENSSNITGEKIQELKKQKNKLENSVNILSNNIRLNKKMYKDNMKIKKNFDLEKVQYDSNNANKDLFSIMKEIQDNRAEIELMKNKIAQKREETKGINNYRYDIERQIMDIKEELKKYNVKITNIFKEKDKLSNDINSIEKKCTTLRSKIDKTEKSTNEFLYNVKQLVKLTQEIKSN